MEFVIFLVVVAVIAVFIYVWRLSSRAKKDLFFTVEVPPGKNVQAIIQDVNRALPKGWTPVGSKKGHSTTLSEWAAEDTGGNLINIASGNMLTGVDVVSVELVVVTTDEFGRENPIPFDQVPPQSSYEGHVWVSNAAAGQGKTWMPARSLKIIKAKEYLAGCLAADTVKATV